MLIGLYLLRVLVIACLSLLRQALLQAYEARYSADRDRDEFQSLPMHYGQVPHPYTREEGTVTEVSLSARERPGASFTACSRRDSAVWCCPVLAAYGESHNCRLTLPFRVFV